MRDMREDVLREIGKVIYSFYKMGERTEDIFEDGSKERKYLLREISKFEDELILLYKDYNLKNYNNRIEYFNENSQRVINYVKRVEEFRGKEEYISDLYELLKLKVLRDLVLRDYENRVPINVSDRLNELIDLGI